MASVDVGQAAAGSLYQQAQSGTFVMDLDAAQRCAQHFQTFAESLDKYIQMARDLVFVDGFGTLDSAKDLQSGFARKAGELVNTLLGMQEAGYQMAAAYLEAANQTSQADSALTKMINAKNQEISL
ncbi:hypothetical protein [Nocardia stercoris]|uniref:hypothetical protein n=1 Tax=Nocardia stercoris TaxID=2483361 RepID=UPI001319ED39|nr:hypothetical protein [Nocardia stercoris]